MPKSLPWPFGWPIKQRDFLLHLPSTGEKKRKTLQKIVTTYYYSPNTLQTPQTDKPYTGITFPSDEMLLLLGWTTAAIYTSYSNTRDQGRSNAPESEQTLVGIKGGKKYIPEPEFGYDAEAYTPTFEKSTTGSLMTTSEQDVGFKCHPNDGTFSKTTPWSIILGVAY